jgi:hypothetical protein
MPFFIKSDSILSSFPNECPFCSLREANIRFRQTFSKMKLGKIPGSVASEKIKPLLPACEECAKWFRLTRVALFLLGFVALLGPILLVLLAFEVPNYIKLANAAWLTTIALWASMLTYRKIKGNNLKIVYFSDNEIIYSGKDKKYMSELSKLNDLSYDKKPFVARLS